jgi:hypothetical protein
MKRLIYSGLLYLAGVSTVLYLKPDLMFNKDGEWKEFGLGRNQERYTWMPFWLFTILWAMLSYLIVLSLTSSPSNSSRSSLSSLSSLSLDQSEPSEMEEIVVMNDTIEPENVSTKALSSSIKKRPNHVNEMKKGYYILDVNETAKKGIPKYIYLGPEAPNVLFHDQTA